MPQHHLGRRVVAALWLAFGLTAWGCGEDPMVQRSQNMSFVATDSGLVAWGKPIRFHLVGRRWEGPMRWSLWSMDAQGRQSRLLAEGALAADAPHVQSVPHLAASPDAPPRSTWEVDSRLLPAPKPGDILGLRLVVTASAEGTPVESHGNVVVKGTDSP